MLNNISTNTWTSKIDYMDYKSSSSFCTKMLLKLATNSFDRFKSCHSQHSQLTYTYIDIEHLRMSYYSKVCYKSCINIAKSSSKLHIYKQQKHNYTHVVCTYMYTCVCVWFRIVKGLSPCWQMLDMPPSIALTPGTSRACQVCWFPKQNMKEKRILTIIIILLLFMEKRIHFRGRTIQNFRKNPSNQYLVCSTTPSMCGVHMAAAPQHKNCHLTN